MKKTAQRPRVATNGLKLADLYEADETAWLEQTAKLVRQQRYAELDRIHLAEYLTDMAKRDRREVESRLVQLLAHLLKWEYQPDHRSKSWLVSIIVQHREIAGCLDSGSLLRHAEEVLPRTYEDALLLASAETGLVLSTFPSSCPYSIAELLQLRREEFTLTEPDRGKRGKRD
jgi:hypothetical protein